MNCPLTAEDWERYQETADPEIARHIAACSECRAAGARLARVVVSLPAVEPPEAVAARFQGQKAATEGKQLACEDARETLEAWRAGELDAVQAFLVEDHLLWCEACEGVLARAEQVTEWLRDLPSVTPPAVIAERIAAARAPWWRRLAPAPVPIWASAGLAAAVLVGALLLSGHLRRTGGPETHLATQPKPAPTSTPAHVEGSQPGPGERVAIAPTLSPGREEPAPAPRRPIGTVGGERRQVGNVGRSVPAPSPRGVIPAPLMEKPVMRGPEPAATAKDPVRPTSAVEVAEDRTERGARFAYAARDAIYSMARAAELASSEESLSTVPEPTLVAAAVQRPATEAPKAPAVAREPESRSVPVEDLGQSLREDLGRRRGPSSLAPIRVPSEREKTPPGVILLTPM